jgi:hypothetical protein
VGERRAHCARGRRRRDYFSWRGASRAEHYCEALIRPSFVLALGVNVVRSRVVRRWKLAGEWKDVGVLKLWRVALCCCSPSVGGGSFHLRLLVGPFQILIRLGSFVSAD